MRLLAIKSRSSLEIRKKLTLRGFSSEEIDFALKECVRLGFLNDANESRRRYEKLKNKGYGPRYIALKLQSQGLQVPRQSPEEQKEIIRALLKKDLWAKKKKRNLFSALQRRGFDLECILEVISFYDL